MNAHAYILLLLLLATIALASVIALYYDPSWVIVMASSGIAFGALSIIVYSRRLMYMAAASPHSAFLAAAVSIPLSIKLRLPMDLWMLVIGLTLVYLVGWLTYRGMDPDEATSLFVGLSASGGVLASYYVLTRYPYSSKIWAVVFGDPLLSTRREVLFSLAVAGLFVIFSFTCIREIVYIGADVEDARLSGLKVWLYDLALFTSIGLVVIVMIRTVGFILEHVLILIPGLIAHYSSKGVYRALSLSILIALFSSIAGLALSIGLDQSPSAMTGLLLVIEFMIVYFAR
ncbi:MAG: metal ABC transporter permease [Desulfurococcales archaeon]|nr:metal ABC transporter permease [Desulfurococcales archaeon]